MDQKMIPKNIVVTGGNNGIGYQTIKGLYNDGNNVIFGARNVQKNEQVVSEITSQKGGSLKSFPLDLSKRNSIDSFVKNIKENFGHIDILINNAGLIMTTELRNNEELGFEETLVINHFGHFYFTFQLMELVKKAQQGRIIHLSSVAHYDAPNNFLMDLQCKNKKYSCMEQYRISKFFNVLFCNGLNQLLKNKSLNHIKTVSVHPGVVDTGFAGQLMKENKCLSCLKSCFICCLKTPEQGAFASLSLCRRSFEQIRSGEYYDADGTWKEMDKRARNMQSVNQLWKISEKAYGINFQ